MRTKWMLFTWKLANWREQLQIFIAWRLPKSVVKWAFVRVVVAAEPNGNPADVTAIQALKAWG